jgi:RimJ/RimL family protein N-acetyltransferase
MTRPADITGSFAGRAAGRCRRRIPNLAEGNEVVLRDRSAVLIRQIRSDDAPLLADVFDRLSPRSRQLRFLRTKDKLTPAELSFLTNVDHHDHEALAALNQSDGRGVGIARYVRDAEDRLNAEIAVSVVDDWQGKGLGTELMAWLSDRARQEGIRHFTALVSSDNVPMTQLLRKMSARRVGYAPGTEEYRIAVSAQTEHVATGVSA